MTFYLPQNRYFVVFLFSLRHQAKGIDLPHLFSVADYGVDPRSIDAAVSQQIRQMSDISFHLIICFCKKMAEIMRIHFFPGDSRRLAQFFHFMKYIAPVHRFSVSGDKNAALFPRFHIFFQPGAQPVRQKDRPLFPLGADHRSPFPHRLRSDELKLADADPCGTKRLQNQGKTGFCRFSRPRPPAGNIPLSSDLFWWSGKPLSAISRFLPHIHASLFF